MTIGIIALVVFFSLLCFCLGGMFLWAKKAKVEAGPGDVWLRIDRTGMYRPNDVIMAGTVNMKRCIIREIDHEGHRIRVTPLMSEDAKDANGNTKVIGCPACIGSTFAEGTVMK